MPTANMLSQCLALSILACLFNWYLEAGEPAQQRVYIPQEWPVNFTTRKNKKEEVKRVEHAALVADLNRMKSEKKPGLLFYFKETLSSKEDFEAYRLWSQYFFSLSQSGVTGWLRNNAVPMALSPEMRTEWTAGNKKGVRLPQIYFDESYALALLDPDTGNALHKWSRPPALDELRAFVSDILGLKARLTREAEAKRQAEQKAWEQEEARLAKKAEESKRIMGVPGITADAITAKKDDKKKDLLDDIGDE